MILVDTCVLIDVLDDDPKWADWSQLQLDTWSARGLLLINPIIYAELAANFTSIEALNAAVTRAELELRELPLDALFLASKAHAAYRRQGGKRPGVLSDFFIGAHATVLKVPGLTRDAGRFRFYFSGLRLITPPASDS